MHRSQREIQDAADRFEHYFDELDPGSVEVDDKPAMHAHGATWSAPAHVEVSATPGAGRSLTAELPVVGDAPQGEPGPTVPVSLLKKNPSPTPAVFGAAVVSAGHSQ